MIRKKYWKKGKNSYLQICYGTMVDVTRLVGVVFVGGDTPLGHKFELSILLTPISHYIWAGFINRHPRNNDGFTDMISLC